MNTLVALNAGDYVHEFTPAFSWLVLVVLVVIPVIGYFLGRTEVRILPTEKREKGKRVFMVFYSNFAERFAFAILAFFASTIVIAHEHGNGIYQWLLNHSGSSASELAALAVMIIYIGVFSAVYAFIAYKAFKLGIMRSLKIAENLADKLQGVIHQKAYLTIPQSVKRAHKMATTAEEHAAKQPSIIPARR